MATITTIPCDSQLAALKEGLKLLGPHYAQRFPMLSAALANRAITPESGPLDGTASRNTLVTAASSCT